MAFGYSSVQTGTTINSYSQIRRSADMIYQRGNTYNINLTGSTYVPSMEMVVDLYADDSKVGSMAVVPYNISQNGSVYSYNFNVRPYDYLSNYINTEHYRFYWLNDWEQTNNQININNPFPNNITANFKYGYRYLSGSTLVTEWTGATPTNDFNHWSPIPGCPTIYDTIFVNFGQYTNTGKYFDLIGGTFQLEENYIMPNFDQTVGQVAELNSGYFATIDNNLNLAPISQFLMDGPTVPQQSETGRFLTDAPRIQTIQTQENYVLYYLNGLTGDRQFTETDFAYFQFYNENNERINYFSQPLNWSGTTYASPTGFTDTLSVFSLPCGPVDINNIYATIDFSTVAYYTVQLCYGFPTNSTSRTTGPIGPISEVFYFYINGNCLPQDVRVTFLNNRGGYDYYTFTAYRQDTKKISRQTYDSRYYATNLTSPDRDMGRTIKTFATDVEQEIVLESDFISVPVGNWLEQMFYSPQVYIMKPDYISPIDRQDKVYKDLQPVQILSTEVQTITKKHQKLNKYKITMKVANNFFVNKGF
jgi:hypothetical protein